MILGFKTQINNQPTYFVEKIEASLGDTCSKYAPKIHTIRKGNRWKPMQNIHMATGVRTKAYNCFMIVGCTSVQEIEIINISDKPYDKYDDTVYLITVNACNECFFSTLRVKIDGKFLTGGQIDELAINDGFNNAIEFFGWFNFDDFKGQLIHWTDKVYVGKG